MESKFWPKIFNVDPEEFLEEEEINKKDSDALPESNTKYNTKFKERFIKQFDDQVDKSPLHGAD
jgi:hypothetical protein